MAQNDKNSQTDLDGLEKMGMPDGQPRPIACLPIIGQIEGHMALSDSSKTTKYEHILPMLVDIEQNDKVQGLLLLLNTVGGDVEAGLAIAEMVAGMRKPSVSLVIGGGHSIGVPLAVCTRKSFIVPSAHDAAPGAYLRHGHQRAAVGGLSQGDAGAGGAVCLRSFRHEGKALP